MSADQSNIRLNLFFETLSAGEVETIRPLLIERTWDAGETILDADDQHEGLFLIAEGRVKMCKPIDGHEELLIGVRHKGDFFGELEIIDGRPRSSCAVAVDRVTTFELPREHFERLVEQHPSLAHHLLQVMSVRLRVLNHHFLHQMARLSRRNAAEVNRMRKVNEAAQMVNSTLDLDRLLRIILDAALQIVEAENGTLYLVDHEKGELWSKVLRGSELVEIRLPVGRGIAGFVAASGETVRIDDAYLDPRFNPEFDTRTGFRTRSMLTMPIKNKEGRIVGVLQLLNKEEGRFTIEDEEVINALSVHSALALENARLYTLEKQSIALEKELNAAQNVQMSLLPQTHPSIPGYEIYGTSTAATWVGGDYYDYISIDDGRLAICCGDVTGKGLPAALLMANLQAILRSQRMVGPTPRRIMSRVNKLLRQSISEGKFVTLFYGILDAEKHWLVFTNAGHENPYLLRNDGSIQLLQSGGTVLGILDDLFFEEGAVQIEAGETVVMYSDGVTEAANSANELFGLDRLTDVVRRNQGTTAQGMASSIIDAVKDFAGPVPMRDDLTIVVIHRKPDA